MNRDKIMTYKTTKWELIHDGIVKDLQGLPLPDVAKKYNVNYHTLMSYCRRKKIKRPVKKRPQPQIPRNYFEQLTTLHKEGKTVKELANHFGYCERSIARALNHCYMPAEDAEVKAKRVYVNVFRTQIGPWLDECFAFGKIVIKSTKRGEMVLMTAGQYNSLMKKLKNTKEA